MEIVGLMEVIAVAVQAILKNNTASTATVLMKVIDDYLGLNLLF